MLHFRMPHEFHLGEFQYVLIFKVCVPQTQYTRIPLLYSHLYTYIIQNKGGIAHRLKSPISADSSATPEGEGPKAFGTRASEPSDGGVSTPALRGR